ncbi:unnamed protein product, partial [Choristocarpus tenellus]
NTCGTKRWRWRGLLQKRTSMERETLCVRGGPLCSSWEAEERETFLATNSMWCLLS